MAGNFVTESRFYMWRTLFAVAHADGVVTDEEVKFMAHILEDVEFSDEQNEKLKDDIENPKDVEEMFKGIADLNDRIEFFDFAHDLVWVDGDFASEEKTVMIKLQKEHMRTVNVDDMMGKVDLQLEDDNPRSSGYYAPPKELKKNRFGNAFQRFYKSLLGS